MKKLVFSILMMFGMASYSVAAPAVDPYDWNIWEIVSDDYGYENVFYKSRTTEDHGGTLACTVIVWGGYSYTTNIRYNGSVVNPYRSDPYDLDGDTITDAWVLFFETNGGTGGTIEVMDYSGGGGWQLRDSLYVK